MTRSYQKYELFINYFYPVAQNLPRQHGVAKEMFTRDMLGQVNLFIVAGKSNHIGRLCGGFLGRGPVM